MDKQALALRDSGAITTAEQPQNMLAAVLQAVRDPAIDPARLKEFLEIGERLEARQAARIFADAMIRLQRDLPTISKNGTIIYGEKKGSAKFARWDDIHRACKSLLAEHGFSVSFSSELQGTNALRVTMTVTHSGGHIDQGSMVVPWLDTGGSKSPAQQAVSSETLAQRHVFVKYFNILTSDQDDDGSGRGVPERITETQAMRIADILQECERHDAGMTARFRKWLTAEMGTANESELFQGEQLNTVMTFLRVRMEKLGIAS